MGDLKNIRGKRVLVRVDFNVPIERGVIADDTRIQAALPTIDFLLKRGAKVILMSHFGRPKVTKGSRIKDQGLSIVAERLGELLKRKVQTVEKWDFREIERVVKNLKAGEVLMLPNLRLHSGEEKNSPAFARELSRLAPVYVNEAFSVTHRKHASVAGVSKLLPAYAGFRLLEELDILGKLLDKPEPPLVVLMGGAKLSDKAALIKKLVYRAQTVLIGTALANTFFKAAGYGVGASLVDGQAVREAKLLLKNKKIILPEDLVIGDPENPQGKLEVVEIQKNTKPYALCSAPYAIVDIGPRTILSFARHLKSARTLLWNGPVGMYEIKRYSHGTMALARLFASRSRGRAFGVIGGGETIDAMRKTGMIEYVDFISTGGGAMLEFLSGKKLPGIVALYARSK